MEKSVEFNIMGENSLGNTNLRELDTNKITTQENFNLISLLDKIPKEWEYTKNFIENELQVKSRLRIIKKNLLAVSYNELLLASVYKDSFLIIWNLQTSTIIYELQLSYPDVASIIFSKDNKKLWIASTNSNLDYFDIQSQELVSFHSAKPNNINLIASLYEDHFILYSTYQNYYKFINPKGEIVYDSYLGSTMTCAVASKKSDIIYCGVFHGVLYKFTAGQTFEKKVIETKRWELNCMALDSDEQNIYLGFNNDKILMVELSSFTLHTICCERPKIKSLIYIQEKILIIGFKDFSSPIHFYDLNLNKEIRKYKVGTQNLSNLIYLKLSNALLYVNYNGSVNTLDLETFKENRLPHYNSYSFTCCIKAANNEDLITGCDDHVVRVWDLREKREKFILSDFLAPVNLLFITFNKKYLISADLCCNIVVSDSSTYLKYQQFSEHALRIISISCDFLSNFIISSSEDFTIKIWEIKTAKCFYNLEVENNTFRGFGTKCKKYHIDIFNFKGSFMARVWKFKIPFLD